MYPHLKTLPFWNNLKNKSKFFYTAFLALLLWLSASTAWGYDFLSPTLYDAKKNPIALDSYSAFPVIDGIALHWNGTQFEDAQGTLFTPPIWFAKALKQKALIGTLVGKEGDNLDTINRILRQPDAQTAWQRLRFIATDIPQQNTPFDDRWKHLTQWVMTAATPYLQRQDNPLVFSNPTELQAHLDTLYQNGKGGLVLKKVDEPYTNDDLALILALPYSVGEAIVLAHRRGQGELAGMMGSLEVESINGGKFIIGTGFSRLVRQKPPAVDSFVAYKYKGFTATGKPKSPVFLNRIKKQKAMPLIGGIISTTMVSRIFLCLMLILSILDGTTHWRGKRHWDFKSAIVSTGLLGTFVGIWWGLYNFNTEDIASGVPVLLDGLKFAFVTSITGMALATVLSIAQTIIGNRTRPHVE